jgi:superfamily II DNA/RNA helicase
MKSINLPQILSLLQIEALNDMQQACLQATEQHTDIILLADTGSGKTLAFLLPLLQHLNPQVKGVQALIVAPSRELALQIEKVFRTMGTGYKVTCCYGGHKREIEENNLIEQPAVIVGTPGRLGDHIRRNNILCHNITTLVLDEFDKSLEAGFQEEMAFLVQSLPNVQRRMLTSATHAHEIPAFIGLQQPHTLDFLSGKPADMLAIQYARSADKDKADALFQLICMVGSRAIIVFCNHRDAVERTSGLLADKGIVNVFYHGAMEQRDRETALVKFRNGTVQVLVTTDLAARGLDIDNIRYIIHYHLPATQEVYIHRNGRTARMDASGNAVLLLGPDESLPDYVDADTIEELEIQPGFDIPEKSKWCTWFIGAGKKDKVNKIDIVGFLTNKAQLKKEDIGLIEVKDFYAFVAVRRNKASHALQLVKNEKVKGKKVKMEIAK